MRKIITLGIMLLFLGMTISSSTGLYVEKQSSISKLDGNTLYVGGNGTGNYTKIQDAINDSSDGDTVFVYSGTYKECNIEVDKAITLNGEDRDTTIIDGDSLDDGIFILIKDNITLQGFTIQYARYNRNGIWIRSSNNQVLDCMFLDNGHDTLIISGGCNNNVISYCEFYDNRRGIVIYGSDNPTLYNVVSHCTFGPDNHMELNFAKNMVITDCMFDGSSMDAIRIDGSTISNCEFNNYNWDQLRIIGSGMDITVENCSFRNCGENGLDVEDYQFNIAIRNCIFENCENGIRFEEWTIGCTISNCEFINNSLHGIYFFVDIDIAKCDISGCKFINNTKGICFVNIVRQVEVTRCHFEGNDVGILFFPYWMSVKRRIIFGWLNRISENNFVNNNRHIMRDLSDNIIGLWFNSYTQNYWDNWIGYGPYRIFGLLHWDFNPVNEPYDIGA